MQIGRPLGTTRVLGKAQGYMGLPIRDEVRPSGNPCMVSAWFPTPKELATLNAGAPVLVTLLGHEHPPIMVDVGDTP